MGKLPVNRPAQNVKAKTKKKQNKRRVEEQKKSLFASLKK